MDKGLKIQELENKINILEQIIDSIDANIYWKDLDGKFLGMNKKNLHLIGENISISDIVGKRDLDFNTSKDYDEKIHQNDLEVIKSKKSLVFEENYIYNNQNNQNNQNIYLSTKSCLKDNNGNVIGLVGVSIDITERKELEEKIQQQNEELKKKDEIKNQFIQNFSHDLKVPINGLLGRTQLLKILLSASSNQKITQIVEDVENSSMTLETLFNQMRDLVIHEQFDNKIHKTEFTLLDLVNKEFEIAKSSIPPSKNININISTNNNLNNKINSDYYKLSQIIRNLLSNAIKYTDKGNISIKAEALKEDNHINFAFSVADTGIGIGKDHQNSIFEIFNRADITSHKNNRHGMGVGLYIVKNNLDILNGSINLESSLGQGSIFTVKIPL
ncbi:PAS domain-containing sensor histidine kinase [Francisella tularensis subsp. novicida]|uniref:PAS domain-containing sensor histidine kinase n=1 Tax=Francisella tularensis TaxID=263 RepID=UPI000505C3D3|nr:PAS domain-containing sensor histidine kinase [Francisella tularensis]AJJ48293.1 sensory box protein [Francisella tularensis subsp. novicida]KFJ70790.1 sensory box protein [Francisella tularensis subsp. novicida]MBK2345256.1 PAS domain-containing sensor histidine kinase [Francisella tularensis subsp. novicida]MBK2350606.1 PAS domain-containing sensor histidine kinase [Francisella tularensis subsp. novicida]MBK2354164.1 PAS domain-containing sensor histidine kinase [Francisella tularensis su